MIVDACLALSNAPLSGASTRSMSFFLRNFANSGTAEQLNAGIEKKSSMCSLCGSIVITSSAFKLIRAAIVFALIGSPSSNFLSCLLYPKYGIITVIFLAPASLTASCNRNSSTIFGSGYVVCMIITSSPEISSKMRMYNSPSGKRLEINLARGICCFLDKSSAVVLDAVPPITYIV